MATSTSDKRERRAGAGSARHGGVGEQVVDQGGSADGSGVSNFCPAMAVPMTVKMPEPMTAPMPSAVSDQGPSDFFERVLGIFRLADQLIDGLAGKQLA